MTYSEALTETVSRQQAIRELQRHSITEEGLAEFFEACGDKVEYMGCDVLAFLGY